MPTASPKLPPLPAAAERLVMPDGTINPSWHAWLKILERVVTQVRKEIP